MLLGLEAAGFPAMELLGAAALFAGSWAFAGAAAGAFPPDPSVDVVGGFDGLLQSNSIKDNATARIEPNPRTRIISSAVEFGL